MFEEQLELFKPSSEAKKESEITLEGKFAPDFLAAMKLFLTDRLKVKAGLDLAELVVAFKQQKNGDDDCLGAYDQVVVASFYKKLANTSDDKMAQRQAEKYVSHEMVRLAQELGLKIFQPAYPKPKVRPAEPTEIMPEEEIPDKNLKLFGRGGSFMSHSHNEESERK